MQILEATIEGFRSFGPEQVIQLPQEPGLYQLTGRNDLEPNLGANGAGKSSIWDAICWCFFGKTVRGVRGPSVANWNEDQAAMTAVEVAFELNGVAYIVARTQSPNSLSLTEDVYAPTAAPRKVVQADVDALIGVDYEFFTTAILMGQFSRFFFDLSPTEKLNLFGELLHLNEWLVASTRANSALREVNASIAEVSRDLGQAEQRVEFFDEGLIGAKEKSAAFEEEKAAEIAAITGQIEELLAVDDGNDRVDEIEAALNRANADLNDLRARRNEFSGELHVRETELRLKQREIAALNQRARNADELEDVCPTCNREVDGEHLARVVALLQDELKAAEAEKVELSRKVEQSFRWVREKDEQVEHATEACEKLKVEYNAATRKRDQITGQLKVLDELLVATEKKENEYTALIDRIRQDRCDAEIHRGQLSDALADLKQRQPIIEYWKTGFKDLRLWVIEKALTELEISVNNSLIDLGLEGWSVTFDTERENTSGGKTKGFTVLISSPSSDRAVPWEAWSGGETQRLRIAGAVGLADLMTSRRGCACSLEVWDEPTAHLSVEGIDDLLQFLGRRARERSKQIWVVDHRSLEAGDFIGELRVVKEKDGSKIEQP